MSRFLLLVTVSNKPRHSGVFRAVCVLLLASIGQGRDIVLDMRPDSTNLTKSAKMARENPAYNLCRTPGDGNIAETKEIT
jgi:hypothetical protein